MKLEIDWGWGSDPIGEQVKACGYKFKDQNASKLLDEADCVILQLNAKGLITDSEMKKIFGRMAKFLADCIEASHEA